MGNDLETESLLKYTFSCNFIIGHPKTLKDVHFYHSINYLAFLFLASTVISPCSNKRNARRNCRLTLPAK